MLYIILPVHNRAAVTAGFLRALAAQTVHDYTLLLVDDGCTDNTVALSRDVIAPDRLVILRGDGGLWWAGALQRAYEHLQRAAVASDDTVLIVNDDITFERDFLEQGLAVLAQHPHACVQAVGIDRHTGSQDRGAMADLRRLRFRAAGPTETANCLSTRGLLMRGATFLGSGGLHPRWLPHYLSDYEFTLRLRRRGVLLKVDDRFRAQVDLQLSGLSELPRYGFRRCWTHAFSNRAKFNPKHWSAFVLFACPIWTVPWHLLRIWLSFARALVAAARAEGKAA